MATTKEKRFSGMRALGAPDYSKTRQKANRSYREPIYRPKEGEDTPWDNRPLEILASEGSGSSNFEGLGSVGHNIEHYPVEPFKPIATPANDEFMGVRNLQNIQDVNKGFRAGLPYRSQFTQDYGSNMAAGRGYIASGLVNDTIASNTGAMDANERYQQLAAREDEIKARILEIDAEINYQTKLREREMMGDPEWEIAKNDYIYKGDRSGMDNIMSRWQTEKTQGFQAAESEKNRQFQGSEGDKNRQNALTLANANKEETKAEKKEANLRSARAQSRVLDQLYEDYLSVKGDENKRIAAARELSKQYQTVWEKAEEAEIDLEDLYSQKADLLKEIQDAIKGGRSDTAQGIADKAEATRKAKKDWNTKAASAKSKYDSLKAKGWSYSTIKARSPEILQYLNVDENGEATVKKWSGK